MDGNDALVLMMFISFIGLLMAGFPVAYCLWGSAILFVGIGYIADVFFHTSTGMGYTFVGMTIRRIYGTMSNWILVSIPMFIYMGLMLEHSGAADRLLQSSQELFGRVRGGLAVTTILIGVLLAASTGIVGASVVLLGMLSMSTMLNQGYSHELTTGTIIASGTLGILIPPSIMLVFMADLTAQSAGDLFLGALFPGLLLGTLYILFVLIYAYFRPNSAPLPISQNRISAATVLRVLRDTLPTTFLILAVLGSIFAGIATVTEASGVGAMAATLLAILNRKLTISVIKGVFIGTFRTVAYIMSILVGATCFALVLRGLGGDRVIENVLTSLPVGPTGIVVCIMLAVFLLGFFLDWMEITFIVMPLVVPVVSKLDLRIDGYGVIENAVLVWFTVMVAVNLQTSFLTPPVGPSIFYLQGLCPKEVKLEHLYRGVIPFILIQVFVLFLVFFWPGLVTWLPSIAYR